MKKVSHHITVAMADPTSRQSINMVYRRNLKKLATLKSKKNAKTTDEPKCIKGKSKSVLK